MRVVSGNAVSNVPERKKMKFKRILGLLLFAFLMNSSVMVVNTVAARHSASGTVAILNASDGTDTFNFTTAQKSVGDTFLINITIADAVNVATWQVGIRWNSSLLNFVNVTLPSDNVFADKSPVVGVDGSTPGLVVIGANVGPDETAFDGKGILAQVTLKISKAPIPGQTFETDLSFEGLGVDTFLMDPSLVVISADYTWNEAHFQYTCPRPSGPVHDVAVTDFVPSNNSVVSGSSLNMNVTILNNGNFTETFNVTVTANSTSVAPTQTISLGSGVSTGLTFLWNTTGWALGDYVLIAKVDLPGDFTPADNTLIYGVIHVVTSPPPKPQPTTVFTDPSTVQSTAIGQNFTVNLNVSNVVHLYLWQAGVTFNATVLKCTGFYEGEFLKRTEQEVSIPDVHLWTIFGNYTTMNNTLGPLYYGGACIFADLPTGGYDSGNVSILDAAYGGVNGSGQLAYLTFTSVGIGVSDVHLTDVMLGNMLYIMHGGSPYIPFEVVENFTVPVNGTNYGVQIANNLTTVSNSTSEPLSGVFNPAFSVQAKKISFDVLATDDWYCQVSVPKELLSCNVSSQWTIKVDGASIPYAVTENATSTALSFSYDKGNHAVEIIGINVLGEGFQNIVPKNLAPSPLLVAAVATLCSITLVAALADLKKTRSFRLPDGFKFGLIHTFFFSILTHGRT